MRRIVLILAGALCATAVATPLASAARKQAQACPAATGATYSQYPGWVTVTDDTGVPYLYPAALYPVAPAEACTEAAPTPAIAPASTDSGRVLPSPYPGWVFVIDDLGVPTLEPIQLAGG